MTNCWIIDLGLVPYAEAYALQQRIVAARKAGAIGDVLLLCEHPHVITQGRNGKREHLLASERVLQQKNIEYFETSRGGDVTYHGPGQIVGYPLLNLAAIRRDVVWYVRMLEEVMIRATADFALASYRVPGKTGMWVQAGASEEKLGAIGVHISRWITSHGFAYNVSTDLRYFDLIVPCGIADRKATSLEKTLGRAVSLPEVQAGLARHFAEVFGLQLVSVSRADLTQKLQTFEQAQAILAIPVETGPAEATQECLSPRSAG
ncbi:MAG TPA: lipoyl(octanoyl) transferase LipB [Candidatus Dormibacteraeota bacterium]|nr:lipoyl(octanoyl) transferase LipB [Candidatus Dormibacteraeota bacterium]